MTAFAVNAIPTVTILRTAGVHVFTVVAGITRLLTVEERHLKTIKQKKLKK